MSASSSTAARKRPRLTFSLRTFLIATLGLALVLGYVGRSRLAAERERQMQELIARSFGNRAWVERPRTIGKPTGQDAAARQALLEVLEQKQDAEFRRDYRIVVPDHGTGLPQDYDVLVYGKYVDVTPSRLEVQVRDGKVTVELATDYEFRRGELPANTVDSMVRQLAYGFMAESELRDPNNMDIVGGMYASHAPDIQIAVGSNLKNAPFHLQTQSRQLLAEDVSTMTEGVEGFAHTRFCNEMTALIREKLPVIQPDDALKNEVVQRLKNIKKVGFRDKTLISDPSTTLLTSSQRTDLAEVDALIFSKLAIVWRIKKAAPEMKRLYLLEAEERLAIVTADDPTDLLHAALTGYDRRLFGFALDYVVDDLTPESTDLLVRSWPEVKDDFRRKRIIAKLKRAALNAERTKQGDGAAYQGLFEQFKRLLEEPK